MAEITSLDMYHRENQVTTLDLFPHNSPSYSIDDPTMNRELGLGLGFSIESTHLCDLDDDVADFSYGFLPSDREDRFFPHPIESSTIPFVKLDTCFDDEEIESSMGIDFGFCFEDGSWGDERERADGMVDEREDMTMFFPSDPVESSTIPFFDEEIDAGIGINFIQDLENEFMGDERERAGGTVDEREGMSMDDDDDEEMGINDWGNATNFGYLDGILYDEFEMLARHLESDDDGGIRNPPAASRNAVENLTAVVVTDADVECGDATCAICRDEMVVGEKAKSLPCLHRYHWCCIDPWLRMRNTCPVCRYELPTDDS